ncbi:hypothetical protein, partial [Acinetobacter baumannii]|uniref:hypothetical protein n=1 Tax=Acinetobacter baumannii TaxID=470 RepID=UPI001C0969F2
ENFRTPALDLDSLYGFGPDGSPHLYERDAATLKTLPSLLIGTSGAIDTLPDLQGGDLPRSAVTGVAI